jgi:hypothetical protein
MVAPTSALSQALKEYFAKEDPMEDVLRLIHSLSKNVLIPLAIAVAVMGGSIQLVKKTQRYLIPPADSVRHQEAKMAYRQGLTQEALKEWKNLEAYGPAHLSIATHELYIQKNPQAALVILDAAREKFKAANDDDLRKLIKSLDGIRFDAQVMLKGNHVMVELSSVVAKEDHLGVFQ